MKASACSTGRSLVSPTGHRSKIRRYCFGKQKVVGWGYPRCKSLGLIEAMSALIFEISSIAYPRCKSLGLIEADYPGSQENPRSRHIRGVKASASLKRLAQWTLYSFSTAYPRCKSLGLIEAWGRRCLSQRSGHIRGVKASASLKLLSAHTLLPLG